MSVTDKRQNGRIDRAQILCGTSHDPREVDHQIWKKILENSWIFLMRQFEKKSKKICKWFKMAYLSEQQLKAKIIYSKRGARAKRLKCLEI